MLLLAVLFAVSTGVYLLPIQTIDLESILDLVQQGDRRKEYRVELDPQGYGNQYGSQRDQDLVETLHNVLQQNSVNNRYGNDNYRDANEVLNELKKRMKVKKNKYNKLSYENRDKKADKNEFYLNLDRDDDEEHHQSYNNNALEQLLSENVYNRYDHRPKLLPSSLVGSLDSKLDLVDVDAPKDSYSKIYVILNPEAFEKSNNKEKLNELLEEVLSLTSSHPKNRLVKNREARYKGFPVKSGLLSRRVRHDSREMYGGKDSMDEEYKPKRSRDRGGSGRTAIPYIRNRGDIYERDH